MKERLDLLLIKRGLFPSRANAQAAIMAGEVMVEGQKAEKPGKDVDVEAKIEIKNRAKYVGRGGEKLEHAIKEFKIKAKGKICLDVGASTGGFTDCLLQNGAKKVYAVDVGYGQIAWKLRQDIRVKVIERTNARYLELEDLELKKPAIELCTIDVSFISLSQILPAVYGQLKKGGEVIALIKPQFEAGKGRVPKGGVVIDKDLHAEVVGNVKVKAKEIGFKVKGVTTSPITGADGNVEFFVYLVKRE